MGNPHVLPLPAKFHGVIDGLKRLDEQGLIYELEYNENYYELESFVNMLVKPGCSVFTSYNMKKEHMMGRNYDFSHYAYNRFGEVDQLTGLAVVLKTHNPAAKYASVGIADGYWMDQVHGSMFAGVLDDGKTDISALALTPYICMDAMNDQGLAVSIMYLETRSDWELTDYRVYESLDEEGLKKAIVLEKAGEEPAPYDFRGQADVIAVNTVDHKAWKNNKTKASAQNDPGKKTVFHTVLMRMMVDYCSCVEEACALAQSVNVISPMQNADFHVMVADRKGKSVILEWVDGVLYIQECTHATNFYVTQEGQFGNGHARYQLLEAALNKYDKGMPERAAVDLMSLVSQDKRDGSDVGFTQWSALYNLAQNTVEVYLQMDYSKAYHFKAE